MVVPRRLATSMSWVAERASLGSTVGPWCHHLRACLACLVQLAVPAPLGQVLVQLAVHLVKQLAAHRGAPVPKAAAAVVPAYLVWGVSVVLWGSQEPTVWLRAPVAVALAKAAP